MTRLTPYFVVTRIYQRHLGGVGQILLSNSLFPCGMVAMATGFGLEPRLPMNFPTHGLGTTRIGCMNAEIQFGVFP